VAVDWESFKANRYSEERPPQGWGWPENIRPISGEGLRPCTHKSSSVSAAR